MKRLRAFVVDHMAALIIGGLGVIAGVVLALGLGGH